MRFELEMQMVEFLFDTLARFKVLPSFIDDVVFARVAGFFVTTRVYTFATRWHEVGVCHRGTNENTQRE